jgi:threonine dehydratase
MNSRNRWYSKPVGPSWSPLTTPATPSMSAEMWTFTFGCADVGAGQSATKRAQKSQRAFMRGSVRILTRMILPTPLERADLPGVETFLKREDLHELGAFKWRGALPALERYRAEGASAVVTASTGNHGAATAWAAQRLGLEAIVYVPQGAGQVKVDRLRQLGVDLRLAGADLDEAKELGLAHAAELELPFFEDGAEPAQYDGYAAIGEEVLDQLEEPPAAVVVPVGNGALLGGIGRALLRRSPETLRVGVVAAAAPVMADSWDAGRPVTSDRSNTFADGLAVRVAIPYAVEVLNEVATHMLRVGERDLAAGVTALAGAGIRAEGAAAAGLAALRQLPDVDGPVVLVVTGRNIDDSLLHRARTSVESFPA